MVSGLSAAELEGGGEGTTPATALRPVLRGIGLFVAGFTLVFVALGAAASGIGRVLDAHQITLAHVSGVVIIFLGVVMLLGALPSRVWAYAGSGAVGAVSRVTGEHRFDVRPSKLGTWAAPLDGDGVRLRLDALRRTGSRGRAEPGCPQRDASGRSRSPLRLLARSGRALRARRSRRSTA